MPTIKIVSRHDSSVVLYEHETTSERQASGLAMRDALEAACKDGADLAGANLARANLVGACLARAKLFRANLVGAKLVGAKLVGADLAGANLVGANLAGADLVGANLVGAYLAGANLDGANLDAETLAGAYLAGAYLDGANLDAETLDGACLDGATGEKLTLVGLRPVLQVGPIGYRCAVLSLYLTDAGPMVRAGCFWDSLDEFEARCKTTHGNSEHGKEYAAAMPLLRAHAELWTPAKEAA